MLSLLPLDGVGSRVDARLEARMLYCKFVCAIKGEACRRHMNIEFRALHYINLRTFLVPSRTTNSAACMRLETLCVT